MKNDLRKKIVSALGWKYAERMLAQVISTVVGIILARILDPEHYGIIAIVQIFISICNVFVVTGLGEALVQKKDADETDFSTVFYINLLLAFLLYSALFFLAPVISKYYGEEEYPQLVSVVRVMGMRLITAAINSIQNAKVSREMDFQKFFWVTLLGTVTSAVVGIWMAYSGYGVWALVAQYLTNSTIDTIMLFIFVRWRPQFIFSMKRAIPLVKYGSRILFVSVFDTVYEEIRSLIIGKRYTVDDLAYYSKGATYPKLIVNNLNSAISSVLFPAFAKMQDNHEAVMHLMKSSLQTTSFFIFPAMIGLAVVSKNFVSVLLTDKWLPCVPFLQLLCVVYLMKPIGQPNNQCMTALGHTGLYVGTNIAKKIIGILILILTYQHGVLWIAIGQVISVAIDYSISAFFGGRLVNYRLHRQLFDLFPHFCMALFMGGVVYLIGWIPLISRLLLLILQIIAGVLSYILISIVFRDNTIKKIWSALESRSK